MGAVQASLFKRGAIQTSLPTHGDNNLETWSLVWLDDLVNDAKEYSNAQQKLRTVINHLETFKDARKCKKYIKSVPKEDRIVLIVNSQLGREIVPRIHPLQQVNSIYVYTMDQARNEEWTEKFTKLVREDRILSTNTNAFVHLSFQIKGVVRELDVLVAKIKSDQARRRHKANEPLAINIFKPTSVQEKSTTELNGKFIHSAVSIDVLLRMKSVSTDKNELIKLCKEEYKDNEIELAIVHEFQQDYSSDQALWWYTRESFLYRLLNKALRVQNIDMLFLFRFFIRDIERQLARYKCSAPISVYRGQLMSIEELQVLKDSIGQFISMNSFLSTSIDRRQALNFLDVLEVSDDLQRVLFTIDADPRLDGVKPFANITAHSYFDDEQEVLMMLGSIFQLVNIRCDGQVWFVQLRLCGDNDHDLKPMVEHMKNKYGGEDKQTDLLSFGSVLSDMGKFDDAEKYFHLLLKELPHDHDGIADCYHNLGEIASEKGDYDSSLEWYYKSLDIKIRTLKSDHPDLAESYNSIGVVHRKKGDYKLALESYNKALAIFQRSFDDDHPNMAKCFNNIGNVYQMQKRYLDALNNYQKALTIQEKHLPSDHPDLGSSHTNIGGVYQCLGQYDRALEHYRISLKILEKSLPSQHPSIAMTLKNMGVVYEDKGELQQALTYFEKAAIIRRHTWPSTHPSVRLIEEDIQRVSVQLKRFSKITIHY